MHYLIDTHVYLWFLSNDHRLSSTHTHIMSRQDAQLFLSYVSIWEIVIKSSKGKLELQTDIHSFIEYVETLGIQLINLEKADFEILSALPFHHSDPFDRLLIAQAKQRNLSLLTSDHAILKYGDELSIV